jgi:hydroxyacyl-ACP dehydratase HTD2-like protein with hotdog domain
MALQLADIEVGMALPERRHCPDNVQLFFYNAALWNAHRIHFDAPYAGEVEGYPGLVIAGPLMGDWLGQCVQEWLGDAGRLLQISYSNRQAAYIGETLTAGGEVIAVDPDSGQVSLELHVKNEQGEVITPGSAVVAIAAPHASAPS